MLSQQTLVTLLDRYITQDHGKIDFITLYENLCTYYLKQHNISYINAHVAQPYKTLPLLKLNSQAQRLFQILLDACFMGALLNLPKKYLMAAPFIMLFYFVIYSHTNNQRTSADLALIRELIKTHPLEEHIMLNRAAWNNSKEKQLIELAKQQITFQDIGTTYHFIDSEVDCALLQAQLKI